MDDPDHDYDFEAIFSTLTPLYAREGAEAVMQMLRENNFPEPVINEIIQVLAEADDPRDTSYFDG